MERIFSVHSLQRREPRPQVIHCLCHYLPIPPSIQPSLTHLSTHPSTSLPIPSPSHLGNKLMTLHWAPYLPHSSFALCAPPPTSPGFLGFWILSGAANGIHWEETEGGRGTPQLYYLPRKSDWWLKQVKLKETDIRGKFIHTHSEKQGATDQTSLVQWLSSMGFRLQHLRPTENLKCNLFP